MDEIIINVTESVDAITVDVSELGSKGNTGPAGANGVDGARGERGETGATGATGATGPKGNDGSGVPAGGVLGQVPVKRSSTDFDFEIRNLTKSDVGLPNVDNTADVNKPVSTAQGAAIGLVDTKASRALQNDTDIMSAGYVSGGTISIYADPSKINIAAGFGYLFINGVYTKIPFGPFAAVPVPSAGHNFIAIDQYGALIFSGSQQDPLNYIILGEAYFNADLNAVRVLWNIPLRVGNFPYYANQFISDVFGTIIASGLAVSEKAHPDELKLAISSGVMYDDLTKLPINQTSNFIKVSNTADNGISPSLPPDNLVDVKYWNDVTQNSGAQLVEMTAGYWKKDLIVANPNGTIYVAFGTAEYATQDLAAAAPLPSYSDQMLTDRGAFLYTIVSQKGDTSIGSRLKDVRPMLTRVFGTELAASGGTVVDYNSLINKPFIPTAHSQLTDRDIAGNHHRLIPTSDSTTAIQIMKANGVTPVMNFDTLNEEITVVGTGTPAALSGIKFNAYDTTPGFQQINNQNLDSGTSSSSDIVATADNGSDSAHYIDTGINSSGYSDPTNYPSQGPNDGYVQTGSDNLFLIAGGSGKTVKIMAGGTQAGNLAATFAAAGVTIPGTVAASNLSGNNTGDETQQTINTKIGYVPASKNYAVAMAISMSMGGF